MKMSWMYLENKIWKMELFEDQCKIQRAKLTFLIFFLQRSLNFSFLTYGFVYLEHNRNLKPCEQSI